VRDDIWEWIQPKEIIDTNGADQNPDGIDDYPRLVLVFVFVSNGATNWKLACQVIAAEGDFPDTDRTSDHRPLEVTIKFK
jgi:hypothetical protein